MAKKQTAKRELENPGDLSISLAPGASKKAKAQLAPSNNTKTRLATKQAKTGNANAGINSEGIESDLLVTTPTAVDAGATKQRPHPKIKVPAAADQASEPEHDDTSNPPTIKAKKPNPPQKLATSPKVPEPMADPAPTPPAAKTKKSKGPKETAATVELDHVTESGEDVQHLSSASKKPSRSKKPSAVAVKVNEQAITQQNTKEAKAAKKAKKAEAVVINETPEETAAFLAKAKGQSAPLLDGPATTSPKRKKLTVDRAKAMEQLVSSHAPSPNPSLVSGISAATETSTRTSSIAPDDSVSQTGVSKSKKLVKPSLQVSHSGSGTRDVSPAAPPHLDIPSPDLTSRDVSPATESIVAFEEDYDVEFEASRVDIHSLLEGIPKPWNVGPAVMPPALSEPLHTAKLSPDALLKLSQGRKDKSKPTRAAISNFRSQDQGHLSLNIEYMDDLIVNVHAFPDDDTRWTFAVLSNYWACKKLGRNYRLTHESEHCRLLYARVSQVRGRLVAPSISDGIRDNYKGLAWTLRADANKADAQNAIRKRVTDMIQDGSFLTPDGRPTAYYQNDWFGHVLKRSFWHGPSSKGFDKTHAAHYSGISYPMLALVVTATEKMLAVVAGGLNAATTNHRSATSAFSHKAYAQRFDTHLSTLVQLHHAPGGQFLTDYLTQLHQELRGSHLPSTTPGPAPKLAIPLSALKNYGMEPKPQVAKKGSSKAPTTSSSPRAPGLGQIGSILKHPNWTDAQKLDIINVLYETADDNPPSRSYSHSSRSSRQFEGLLTEVNEDSDDSEVEARRAGALPDIHGKAKPVGKTWATGSDEETHSDGEGGSKGDGEGSGGQAETKGHSNVESEVEVDLEDDLEEETAAEPVDRTMATLEAGSDGDAASTSSARSDMENPSDDEAAARKSRGRRFFTKDGSLPPCSSDGDRSSVGEGGSGANLTQADGDQTMISAADSDEAAE
ncbi:hypothetical protein BDV93DRAFT_543248 [Ceratobasidium sp. AG-I]|nr:hypothetical protein BDV93DRAFT_543248 [Ceratobasidium sp. AG-I]